MAFRTLSEQNKQNKKNEQVFINAGVPYENVTDDKGQTYQTWGDRFYTPTGGGKSSQDYFNTYGHIGTDSLGGMFDKSGNSNSDNYLLNTIGLSREQVNTHPLLAGLSDKAIQTAYNQTQPFATSLYYNPNTSGFNVSSVADAGSVSIDDIQQALAQVAGWTPYQQSTFAPVIGPTGYNAANAALAGVSNGAYGSSGEYPGYTAGGGTSSATGVSSGSGSYNSPYQQQIADLLAQIMGRGEFTYDFNADPIYQQYKDRYTQAGKLANMDAQANAAALTGGYGNSWAQTVGQQQEQQYLQQLNDVIPDLYDYNYGLWSDQNDWLVDQLGLYQGLDDTEWQRWNADREYAFSVEQAMWERAMAEAEAAAAASGSGTGSSSEDGSEKKKKHTATPLTHEEQIADAAAKYYIENPTIALDSRTLDNWLYDNGYQGTDAQLFKAFLEDNGSTYSRQTTPTWRTKNKK